MLPILFEIGPIEIRSYGVFVALAFIASWFVVRHELSRRAGRGDAADYLVLAAAVGGFVGARLYWYAEHAATVPPSALLSGAGFTWYGGVLGATIAVVLVARRLGVRLSDLLATAAPALALGYAVGRLACQFAGDGTYGKPSDLPWAMAYPNGVVPTDERVHPTPVYETLAHLIFFAILWRLRDRLPAHRLFGLYLVLASVERFAVEFLRINDEAVLGLTQPQLFALAFTAIGVALLAWRRPALRGEINAGALTEHANKPA